MANLNGVGTAVFRIVPWGSDRRHPPVPSSLPTLLSHLCVSTGPSFLVRVAGGTCGACTSGEGSEITKTGNLAFLVGK